MNNCKDCNLVLSRLIGKRISDFCTGMLFYCPDCHKIFKMNWNDYTAYAYRNHTGRILEPKKPMNIKCDIDSSLQTCMAMVTRIPEVIGCKGHGGYYEPTK